MPRVVQVLTIQEDLSNDVIKVHIREIKVFVNLTVIAHGPRPKNDKLGPQRNFGFDYII